MGSHNIGTVIMRPLLLTLLLAACGSHRATPQQPATDLRNKRTFYCEDGKKLLAERHHMDDEGDSALFTALFLTACPSQHTLDQWHVGGKWYRNPAHDAYPRISASSWSRDMTLGVMLYWERHKRLADVQDFIKFGEQHKWDMCGGEAENIEVTVSRCMLSPQLIQMLYDLERRLSGEKPTPQLALTAPNTGFRAHLDVLRVILAGRIYGFISDGELEILRSQAERQPHNALFVAAYERYGGPQRAEQLLLRGDHFPADRLPNNHSEHCINYLFSRDEDSEDWRPCVDEPLKTHDGTDFVFAVSVLGGE